jgi:hypothetical protein
VQLASRYQVVYGYIEWRLQERNHEQEVGVYLLPLNRDEREAFARLDLESDAYAKGKACRVLMNSKKLAEALGIEKVTREALGKLLNLSDAEVGALVKISSDMSEELRQLFVPIRDIRTLQEIASLPLERAKHLAQVLPNAKNTREFVMDYAKAVKSSPEATSREIERTLAEKEAVSVDLTVLSQISEEYRELLLLPELKNASIREYIDTSVYEHICYNLLGLALNYDLNRIFPSAKLDGVRK